MCMHVLALLLVCVGAAFVRDDSTYLISVFETDSIEIPRSATGRVSTGEGLISDLAPVIFVVAIISSLVACGCCMTCELCVRKPYVRTLCRIISSLVACGCYMTLEPCVRKLCREGPVGVESRTSAEIIEELGRKDSRLMQNKTFKVMSFNIWNEGIHSRDGVSQIREAILAADIQDGIVGLAEVRDFTCPVCEWCWYYGIWSSVRKMSIGRGGEDYYVRWLAEELNRVERKKSNSSTDHWTHVPTSATGWDCRVPFSQDGGVGVGLIMRNEDPDTPVVRISSVNADMPPPYVLASDRGSVASYGLLVYGEPVHVAVAHLDWIQYYLDDITGEKLMAEYRKLGGEEELDENDSRDKLARALLNIADAARANEAGDRCVTLPCSAPPLRMAEMRAAMDKAADYEQRLAAKHKMEAHSLVLGDFNSPSHEMWGFQTETGKDATEDLKTFRTIDDFIRAYKKDPRMYLKVKWPLTELLTKERYVSIIRGDTYPSTSPWYTSMNERDQLDFIFARPADGKALVAVAGGSSILGGTGWGVKAEAVKPEITSEASAYNGSTYDKIEYQLPAPLSSWYSDHKAPVAELVIKQEKF